MASRTKQLFFAVAALCVLLTRCSSEWQNMPREPYMGQTVPADVPRIFAPGVISLPGDFEFAGVFSPDMRSFYYSRRDSVRSDQNIWFVQWEKDHWTRPAPAPFAQEAMSYEPVFHPDGQTFFFGSQRPFEGNPDHERLTFFWKMNRTINGWSEPERVAGAVGDALPSYISISLDSTLYFGSYIRPGIQMAQWTQQGYLEPVTVTGPFDSLQGVGHPYIAPDRSYMIVDAQNGPGHQGYMDLYVTFKIESGWAPAVNLGQPVNTPATELAASVTPDGRYMIFNRTDMEGGDLYWVDADILQKLSESADL